MVKPISKLKAPSRMCQIQAGWSLFRIQTVEGDERMEYFCQTCQHVFETEAELCPHLSQFFTRLHGQKLWRIRFLHRYAYEFYSDSQLQELLSNRPLMVSEVLCVDQFDSRTFSGRNALGARVSIFD